MALVRRLWVILLMYVTRPAFLVVVATGLLAHFGGNWIGNHLSPTAKTGIVVLVLRLVVAMLEPVAFLALVGIFFIHVREQLMGPRAALTPNARGAHLAVAGILFTVLVLALGWALPVILGQSASRVGMIIIFLSLMTLCAYAALVSPWFLVVLAAMLGLMMFNPSFKHYLTLISTDLSDWYRETPDWRHWPPTMQAHVRYIWTLRLIDLSGSLLALALLVYLYRPLPSPSRPTRLFLQLLSGHRGMPTAEIGSRLRKPLAGLLSRGRYRRLAVHSRQSPWALAGGIWIILVGLMLLIGRVADVGTQVSAAILLVTLVPGAVVARGWWERWPNLGYESLYPGARRNFVLEMAVALASDLAEFWLAAFIAGAAALAMFHPTTLLTVPFLASIAVSAMMQVLWLGAILCAGRIRVAPLYTMLLLVLGAAMFVPIVDAWSPRRPLSPHALVVCGLIAMGLGIGLAAGAIRAWRTAEFA